MEFSPYFRRPPYYYPSGRYNRNYYGSYKRPNYDYQNKEKEVKKEEISDDTRSKKNDENIYSKKSQEEPIFEVFGLNLYFDDILIIALIFFLYNEGVRDNMLFVSLILLLLS